MPFEIAGMAGIFDRLGISAESRICCPQSSRELLKYTPI